MTKKITVLAARDFDSFATKGADAEDTFCDTIKEAKARAKYFLTEEYRLASECSERLTYACVLLNGECVYDFFA